MVEYKGCKYCEYFRFDGTCTALPDKIPLDIVSGATKHTFPLPNQGNSIVYKPATEPLLERIEKHLNLQK